MLSVDILHSLVPQTPPRAYLPAVIQGVYAETYAQVRPQWSDLPAEEESEDDVEPTPCVVGRVSTDARAIPVNLRTRSLCTQCLEVVTPEQYNCSPNCTCVDTVIFADCPLAQQMLACPRDEYTGVLQLTHELRIEAGKE